jgi:hypothetical protein
MTARRRLTSLILLPCPLQPEDICNLIKRGSDAALFFGVDSCQLPPDSGVTVGQRMVVNAHRPYQLQGDSGIS